MGVTLDDLGLLLQRQQRSVEGLTSAVRALAERPEPAAPEIVVQSPPAPRAAPVALDEAAITQALAQALSPAIAAMAASQDQLQAALQEFSAKALRRPEMRYASGAPTEMGLRNATNNRINPARQEDVEAVRDRLPDLTGTYKLYAGVSGTADVQAGERIVGVHCVAGLASATVTIGSLSAITVPATRPFTLHPHGNVVGEDVVFAGTVSYVVEVLA